MTDTPTVTAGFPEAWATFTTQLGPQHEHSSYERKLAEAFYCIGKTAALDEILAREAAPTEATS